MPVGNPFGYLLDRFQQGPQPDPRIRPFGGPDPSENDNPMVAPYPHVPSLTNPHPPMAEAPGQATLDPGLGMEVPVEPPGWAPLKGEPPTMEVAPVPLEPQRRDFQQKYLQATPEQRSAVIANLAKQMEMGSADGDGRRAEAVRQFFLSRPPEAQAKALSDLLTLFQPTTGA